MTGMNQSLTIWTLNRASRLFSSTKQTNKLLNIFRQSNISVSMGDRRPYSITNHPGREKPAQRNIDRPPHHQLMYEHEDMDEYFLPIPLKCIGRKIFELDSLDVESSKILRGIQQHYSYFRNEDELLKFWDRHSTDSNPTFLSPSFLMENQNEQEEFVKIALEAFGRTRMGTKPGMGYYEILENWSATHNSKHILIGYSQGGLVARYLAFLDRHVFKKNIIQAIITVASPNYGSPLANHCNQESIANGIGESIKVLFSLHSAEFVNLHNTIKLPYNTLYSGILRGFQDSCSASTPHPSHELLGTAIKWLSGLSDEPNSQTNPVKTEPSSAVHSAFDDLDIRNLYNQLDRDNYSVLNLIEQYPLDTIYYGSIITGNNDPVEFFRSLLAPFGFLLVSIARKISIWQKTIYENIEEIGNIFKSKILLESDFQIVSDGEGESIRSAMVQRTGFHSQTVETLIYNYNHGFVTPGSSKHKVPERSHDFVIPSSYQVLPDGPYLLDCIYLGNANHSSAGSLQLNAGRQSVRSIVKLLKTLRTAMEAQNP